MGGYGTEIPGDHVALQGGINVAVYRNESSTCWGEHPTAELQGGNGSWSLTLRQASRFSVVMWLEEYADERIFSIVEFFWNGVKQVHHIDEDGKPKLFGGPVKLPETGSFTVPVDTVSMKIRVQKYNDDQEPVGEPIEFSFTVYVEAVKERVLIEEELRWLRKREEDLQFHVDRYAGWMGGIDREIAALEAQIQEKQAKKAEHGREKMAKEAELNGVRKQIGEKEKSLPVLRKIY